MRRPRPVHTRREHGQGLIEFTLTVGFLVLLMVSMLELTMLIYNYVVLTDAAKEGVRYAIVHGSSAASPSGPGASPGVTTTVNAFLAASVHDVSKTTVDIEYPDGDNHPGNRVEVTVSYPYNPLFLMSWADWPTITLSANSVGRIQF